MAVSETYLNFIKDRLDHINNWEVKKMFGGAGIFRAGNMFAMISSKDKFYLRVSDETIPEFESKGMKSFSHDMNSKAKMPYYECPIDVLESNEDLSEWVEQAYGIAEKAKKKKNKRKKKR